MKARSKLGLAGLLLGAITSCASIKPVGSIDIAYVPERTSNGIMNEEEFMTELDAGLNLRFNNFPIGLTVGGRQRTYFVPFYSYFFSPHTQEYDVYGNIEYNPSKRTFIDLYFEHMCSHPVDTPPFSVFDKLKEKDYLIGTGDITRIGLRFELK